MPVDFNERRLRVIAKRPKGRVETRISIYLCRDPLETLMSVLKPHSLVVVGSCKRWWPTAEKRLAAKLRQAGHEVSSQKRTKLQKGKRRMLDLFYVAIGCLFLSVCWAFTKACDKL